MSIGEVGHTVECRCLPEEDVGFPGAVTSNHNPSDRGVSGLNLVPLQEEHTPVLND